MQKTIRIVNRILLLLLVIESAYGVVLGGNGKNVLAIWAFTIGFGVVVITSLLLLILGYETVEKPLVVIVATLIPLAFSFGLVTSYFTKFTTAYLLFCLVGFGLVVVSRFRKNHLFAISILALVHGVAGLIILLLPVIIGFSDQSQARIVWMAAGGVLIDLGGILFMLDKAGKLKCFQNKLFQILPVLLFLTTTAFAFGLYVF